MVTLFHHPFCPHSRFIRLALGEYGALFDLAEERVWERREEFLLLNPAGATPVLLEEAGPPVMERFYRRHMPKEQGGGPPDTAAMRTARANIRYHMAYISWLVTSRHWLAGDRMTYADLAAAAHLSVVDYLGDVPWNENEAAKHWYARVKSRPAFRPLLAETEPGVPAAASYADLDF